MLTLPCSLKLETDFWTTKCTRCPDALDKLDKLAKDPKYEGVKFASINCDSESGARNIIEEFDDPRWLNVEHYHMETEYKEEAKVALGFKTVPFLVVINEHGQIVQKGSPKQVDLGKIVQKKMEQTSIYDGDDKENINPIIKTNTVNMSRVFTMDEDF